MTDDWVDHRGGDGLVAEHASPAAEWQVRGQDQRGVFVAAGDQLKEQVGGVLLERDVADFVDDEQSDAPQLGQLGWESARVVGGLESGDPVHGGGERDAVPGLGGFDGQADGEVA